MKTKILSATLGLLIALALGVAAQEGGGPEGGGGVTPGGSSFATQYNNAGALGGTGPGTSGFVLTSTGASSAPTFQAIPSLSGTLNGIAYFSGTSTLSSNLSSMIVNVANASTTSILSQAHTGANLLMRNSNWDFQASAFTGNLYNDPVVSFGYNNDANLIVKDHTDPFSLAVHFEGDYQHSLNTGTTTSGTTTTVPVDSGKALAVNVYAKWVFYNTTRSQSRLIVSNTATTYTLESAITGQVSGDSYQILRRDMESYWQTGFWNGAALKTLRPIFFAVDRGTIEATGAPSILQTALQTNASTGLELQGVNSDWTTTNHATFAPNVWTMIPFGAATDTQLLMRAATAKTSIIDMQYNAILAGRIQGSFTSEMNLLVYNSSGSSGLGALKLRRNAANWTSVEVGQAADMGQAVININNSGQTVSVPLLRLRTATSQTGDLIQMYDQDNSTKRWKVDSTYNTVPRLTAGATGDTNGFFYLPSVAGVPTGVPANITGEYANAVPLRYDSSNNRIYAYNSSWQNLTPAAGATSADVQIFTSTGANTWTKPANAKVVDVFIVGGGGSGGSGRVGTTTASGGGGGGGGGVSRLTFQAALLGATETVTVGAGGAGVIPSVSGSTNGTNGNPGGNTTFGTWLRATGGALGAGGTAAGSDAGGAGGIGNLGTGTAGGTSGSTGAAGAAATASTSAGAGGGGAGGGATSAAARSVGGNGAAGNFYQGTAPAGGAGVTSGNNQPGGTGTAVTTNNALGGGGGGGPAGGGSSTSSSGLGGSGGLYGGGGSGGGGCVSPGGGTDAGCDTSGSGANGIAIVVTYF